ncbi:uncharacterized protein FN964_004654 [Alca torda]
MSGTEDTFESQESRDAALQVLEPAGFSAKESCCEVPADRAPRVPPYPCPRIPTDLSPQRSWLQVGCPDSTVPFCSYFHQVQRTLDQTQRKTETFAIGFLGT